jgi:predicted nucleic acid-binding protein
MRVVADTGPLNYLALIGAIDLLPKLFDKIVVPEADFPSDGAPSRRRLLQCDERFDVVAQ